MMSSWKQLSFFLVLMTTSLPDRSYQCTVPSPCTCSGTTIYCSNKQFTSVPALVGVDNTTYSLMLSSNPNLVIKDDSFAYIALEYLNLDFNTNMTISNHAFRTQTNTLKELHMSYAQLDMAPDALRDLHVLEELYISHNSIQQWDLVLMERLTVSLKKLDITNNGITSWPNWIKHMSDLHWLDVSKNPLRVIPHNAFQGFEWRLTYLNLQDTGLTDIPTGLQTLHKLAELHIGGSTLSDSSFYETWIPSHASNLETLHIDSTQITKIPVGFRGVTWIKSLYIEGSQITHVDEESMPVDLKTLYLTGSLITHIHGGICSSSLNKLEVDNNAIESIEKHDLQDCYNLTYFSADDNIINYISSGSFDQLKNMETLYLQRNKLVKIPTTIQHLHSLSYITLGGNPLECTCQDDWFPEWRQNNSDPSIDGRCLNLGIELEDFNPHC